MHSALTESEIACIRTSWNLVKPHFEEVGQQFYQRLFSMDAEISSLFHEKEVIQGRKLMFMMNAAVDSLSHTSEQRKLFLQLGTRHNDYGVRPRDFHTMGVAWLLTLQAVLGDNFTQAQYDAWLKFYQYLTRLMMNTDGSKT